MFGIGMTELMVIFVIGLLVLGPKRLPELARSLGRGLAEFRRASLDIRKEFMDVAEEARIRPPSLEETASDMPPQAGELSPRPAPEREAKQAQADAQRDARGEPPATDGQADAGAKPPATDPDRG